MLPRFPSLLSSSLRSTGSLPLLLRSNSTATASSSSSPSSPSSRPHGTQKLYLPRDKNDTRGIEGLLEHPLVVVKNAPKSAIGRDIIKFLQARGPIDIDSVYCFRNDDLQPIGSWLVILKTFEDARLCLRTHSRPDLNIGANKPEVLSKGAVNDRFLRNYFFFELGHAAGRTVLVRGLDQYLPGDVVRNHLRTYELSRERNIIPLEKENRNSGPSFYLLLKMNSESEAHRLVRERDNTKVFLKATDRPLRLELLY